MFKKEKKSKEINKRTKSMVCFGIAAIVGGLALLISGIAVFIQGWF